MEYPIMFSVHGPFAFGKAAGQLPYRPVSKSVTIDAMDQNNTTAEIEEHRVEDSRSLREIVIHLGYMRRDLADLKIGSTTRLARVEEDITHLQQFRWWVVGVSAGVSMGCGLIGSLIALKILGPTGHP